MGDVGAVAALLDTLVKWAIDPSGYAAMTREQKLENIHATMLEALAAGQYDVLDRLLAELKRVRDTT